MFFPGRHYLRILLLVVVVLQQVFVSIAQGVPLSRSLPLFSAGIEQFVILPDWDREATEEDLAQFCSSVKQFYADEPEVLVKEMRMDLKKALEADESPFLRKTVYLALGRQAVSFFQHKSFKSLFQELAVMKLNGRTTYTPVLCSLTRKNSGDDPMYRLQSKNHGTVAIANRLSASWKHLRPLCSRASSENLNIFPRRPEVIVANSHSRALKWLAESRADFAAVSSIALDEYHKQNDSGPEITVVASGAPLFLGVVYTSTDISSVHRKRLLAFLLAFKEKTSQSSLIMQFEQFPEMKQRTAVSNGVTTDTGKQGSR